MMAALVNSLVLCDIKSDSTVKALYQVYIYRLDMLLYALFSGYIYKNSSDCDFN